jgi:hypothetical protein
MARSALGCNRVGVGCRGSCTGGGGGEGLRGGCLLLRLRRLGRLGLGGPAVVSWGSWGGWADFVGAGYGGHAQCDNSSNGGAAMGCLAGESRLGILFGVFAAVVFIELECFGCLLQEFGCMQLELVVACYRLWTLQLWHGGPALQTQCRDWRIPKWGCQL